MFVFVVYIFFILNTFKVLESQRTDNGCWPWSIVLFEIDKRFAQHQKQLIQDRMRHISQRSCLRFINFQEDDSFAEAPRKYLLIRPTNSKHCWTAEEQRNESVVLTIELGTGCTTERGVLHELVHSLGFLHEHQRVDRKCYVKVFWSKITQVSAFSVDFNHPDNDWLQRFPYDKASIMHYSRSTKMKSRDERWNEWEPLGNTDGYLTWWDVWKINYKHCSLPHYCDIYPRQCELTESHEKSLNCKRN